MQNNPLFNVIYSVIYSTENMYVANSVYLHSVPRWSAINVSFVLTGSFQFFHLASIALTEVKLLLSLCLISFPIDVYLSHF